MIDGGALKIAAVEIPRYLILNANRETKTVSQSIEYRFLFWTGGLSAP
jgi:hypothetical protein